MTEVVCSGFEPQSYLKDRCKKCFRLKMKHEDSSDARSDASALKESNWETRRSWREKFSANDDAGNPEHKNEDERDDETTTTTSVSYKTACSNMCNAKSLESISSIYDSKSLATAVSESISEDDLRGTTPTEKDPVFSDLAIMGKEIDHLKEEIVKLKEERQNWTSRRSKAGNLENQPIIVVLEERLAEAENCIQDYRDENAVLKCELRELQEITGHVTESNSEANASQEKLNSLETACNALVEENGILKTNIYDLQQEIEEMQDQYREEEIEEFRELQRELEQNAKNCRVLQFKLRKFERLKDQLQAEKLHLEAKVKDLLIASSSENGAKLSNGIQCSEALQIKELESELRIAKEVSVRLHTELESAEDKRYKLEDEVFYLKEKVRELQTQNKWREARNRAEMHVKRINVEIPPTLSFHEMGKGMSDILEREDDLRDQLKFAEEDLKRTQARLQEMENENEELLRKLTRLRNSKRPPMLRSVSEGHAQIQLQLAEQEIEQLSTKIDVLEKENAQLTKKLREAELNATRSSLCESDRLEIPSELRSDMDKMIAKINELELKNMELNLELQSRDHLPSSTTLEMLNSELRIEKEHKKMLETELTDMKKILVQSENQKLISLATKVEVLNTQLSIVNDRCNNLHRKFFNNCGESAAYSDALKEKCEQLEKQLSEQKANVLLKVLQGDSATTEEIEQCCEVLASVEAQTNRICKQIEKIDNNHKDERRRSLTKENSAAIIAELASVMEELNNVHRLLEAHKVNIASIIRSSPVKDITASKASLFCTKCKETDSQVQSLHEEISFYKKKNKELTNQVLQTEDRWNIELEKQHQIFEFENKNLASRLEAAEKSIEETNHLVESTAVSLAEKTRMLQERDDRCETLKAELLELKREIQEIDSDRKSAKEYEIKYRKLESMFDVEKRKCSDDRTKLKNEIVVLKKNSDKFAAEIDELKLSNKTKELAWIKERKKLEDQLTSSKGEEKSETSESICTTICNVGAKETPRNINVIKETAEDSNVDELKKQLTTSETKNSELANEINKLKIKNNELRAELKQSGESWKREKDNLLHKVRQDEKVRCVEIDVQQQKFTSRMKIMEDTNKSLHSQLVQARRERDYHRESLGAFRRKVSEEEQKRETSRQNHTKLNTKCSDMSEKLVNLQSQLEQTKTDLKLAKEIYDADKELWTVEKAQFKSSTLDQNGNEGSSSEIVKNALKAAENVQKKYSDYQIFYTDEVTRLSAKVKELAAESLMQRNDNERILKGLREQIKVLEISQRNLIQARDLQTGTKEAMETELLKVQENMRLNEVARLSRKYRVTSINEQLRAFATDNFYSREATDIIKNCMLQLQSIKEDDRQLSLHASYTTSNRSQLLNSSNQFTENESESTSVALSDNVSQSSLSIRSYNTLPNSYKWSALHSATVSQSVTSVIESISEISSNHAVRKVAAYPDPPPSLIINKDKSVEYDKNGRMHYVCKTSSRSASNEGRRSDDNLQTINSGINDFDDGRNRNAGANINASSGSNIFYKIRREEILRGGQPSVRLMAKVFDSADKTLLPKNTFSIRKSRSVESNDTTRAIESVASTLPSSSSASITVLGRNTSLSQIEELMGSQSPFGNSVRSGSRNPFKTMGSKIVERVRRSLSRSKTNLKPSEDKDDLIIADISSKLKQKKSTSEKPKVTDGIAKPSFEQADVRTEKPVKKVRTVKKKAKKANSTVQTIGGNCTQTNT